MPQEPVQHGVMLINPNTGIAKLKFNCPNHLCFQSGHETPVYFHQGGPVNLLADLYSRVD